METLQKDPDINMVHTINEPAAAGAYEALKAVPRKGRADRFGRWRLPGVQNVKDGIIGATSQQYPLDMASKGIGGHRGLCQATAPSPPRPRARTSSIPA